MKRIGILNNSTDGTRYLLDIIGALAKDPEIQFFFLINSQERPGRWQRVKTKFRRAGLRKLIGDIFFTLLMKVEKAIFDAAAGHRGRPLNLNGYINNNVIYLKPVFSASGLYVHYEKEDIDKIRALNLDMILRGDTTGIFKGDILHSAKEGIISFHHGDNRWNRGMPAGFWEVYLRKPSTGFVILRLTEELDGGDVLFRGEVQTRDTATSNMNNVFNESTAPLVQIILGYVRTGRLPSPKKKVPFGGKIFKTPSFIQSIHYLIKTYSFFIMSVLDKHLLRRDLRWGVAFVPGPWSTAALRRGVRIENKPHCFFADPFIVTRNARAVCFVEEYNRKTDKGRITAVEILGDKDYQVLGPVLEEPFHLSFPFIFEYGKQLYMVPEAYQSGSIRLYRCVEFPMKWTFEKDLLGDVRACDTMIFEHGQRWWMLTNVHSRTDSASCQLYAYHSRDPLSGPWTGHESNPLIVDSNVARNGGILDATGDVPVRVRQHHGFCLYGRSLTLAKITDLTPSSFREQEIGRIFPDFFEKLRACHHMHSNGRYTVYDFARWESL